MSLYVTDSTPSKVVLLIFLIVLLVILILRLFVFADAVDSAFAISAS